MQLLIQFWLFSISLVNAQKSINYLLLLEDGGVQVHLKALFRVNSKFWFHFSFWKAELKGKFSEGLSKAQSDNSGFRFDVVSAQVNRDDEVASFNSTCDVGSSQSFSAVIDMTWGGWEEMKKEAENNGMPYIRLEAANHQFVKVQSGKLFIFDSYYDGSWRATAQHCTAQSDVVPRHHPFKTKTMYHL